MNFNVTDILSQAWRITWKYKVLWIFGLLASCSSASGRGSSYQQPGRYSGGNPLTPEMTRQLLEFYRHLETWLLQNVWVIYGSIILAGLLLILELFLATVGQTGLIRGTQHADGNIEKLRFGTLSRESLHYFWRVTGLQLMIWGPFVAILIILLTLFILGAEQAVSNASTAISIISMGLFLFLISFCFCVLPLVIVLGFYYRQSLLALLVEDLGVFDSLARGWNVIAAHFGELLIMGILLFGIALVVGIALAIPAFLVMIPLLSAFWAGTIRSWTPFLVAFGLLLAYSPISWFLSGVFRTFSESAWTLTYLRLTQKPAVHVEEKPQNSENGDQTILSLPNA